MALTWKEVVAIGTELLEVEESLWFRTPALKVKGKSFVRLKEDAVTVVFILRSVEEQEELCATKPTIYYITDHYRGYPAVLARLSKLGVRECRERLEIGYRAKAPKKVLAAYEASLDEGAKAAPSPRTRVSKPKPGPAGKPKPEATPTPKSKSAAEPKPATKKAGRKPRT